MKEMKGTTPPPATGAEAPDVHLHLNQHTTAQHTIKIVSTDSEVDTTSPPASGAETPNVPTLNQ